MITLLFLATSSPGVAGEDVRFSKDVLPTLKRHCIICHMPGSAQGELELHPKQAHENLVGVASKQAPLDLVSPGAPEKSYLFLKLTGAHEEAGGWGEKMPFDAAPLKETQIEAVRAWIAAGAKDN